MEVLRTCIGAVFSGVDVAKLTPADRLQDIPDWDSMNGVNLMMEIEAKTGVSLFERGVVLEGGQTLQDVVQLIDRYRTAG